jgi:hypothetical protein
MEMNAVEAGETKETDAKVSVGSSCAGEWAAISQVQCLSAAQAELPQNFDCFVNDLIISRQHDVSRIGHTQDSRSRYNPKRPILRCECFEDEAAQGMT